MTPERCLDETRRLFTAIHGEGHFHDTTFRLSVERGKPSEWKASIGCTEAVAASVDAAMRKLIAKLRAELDALIQKQRARLAELESAQSDTSSESLAVVRAIGNAK